MSWRLLGLRRRIMMAMLHHWLPILMCRRHIRPVYRYGHCAVILPKMKIGKVLGTTSKRQKLVKNLIAEAIRYDLDGINIDFENVKRIPARISYSL